MVSRESERKYVSPRFNHIIASSLLNSLNIARDLCQRRKPYEAVPYLQKALKDPRNIDAGIELAFLAPSKKECVKILEEAADRGLTPR